MLDIQGTLFDDPIAIFGLPSFTRVTLVTVMSGSAAEPLGHPATVPALVLDEVFAVPGAMGLGVQRNAAGTD